MFVTSSLERIPAPSAEGTPASCSQVVNIYGKNGMEIRERSHSLTTVLQSEPLSQLATENSAQPSSSPASQTPTTNDNAIETATVPTPSPRTSVRVSSSSSSSPPSPPPAPPPPQPPASEEPLIEEHVENEVEVNTADTAKPDDNKTETTSGKIEPVNGTAPNEKEEEANKKVEVNEDDRSEQSVSIVSIPTRPSTPSTTPSSTYSRYDIYRWRERPFGPSYRRKERQRREEELVGCNNDNNGNHEGIRGNENGDRFRYNNRFSSPQTFYEDEYSYEPEKKISSMKTVLRTRSMINLDKDDNRTLVRKTLSDANLDQDKNTHFRCNHGINRNQLNDKPKDKQYFGYIEEADHEDHKYTDGRDHNDLLQQLILRRQNNQQQQQQITQQQIDNNHYHYQLQQLKQLEEGTLRQCLRKLLVNNELVIQPRKNQPLDTPNNRRCFYHPVRINRELIDEELPDPDQVKLARDRFERVLKIKGPDAPRGLHRTASIPAGQRITPEVRVPMSNTNSLPANTKLAAEKWTDTGSLSSGVSSASDDIHDDDQPHEVSSEVLQKIRACGTTVTYYGGKVIAQSHGPPSPLTSTIMEEIKFRLEVRDRLMFEEYQTRGHH